MAHIRYWNYSRSQRRTVIIFDAKGTWYFYSLKTAQRESHFSMMWEFVNLYCSITYDCPYDAWSLLIKANCLCRPRL
jgi:hypothetical protein